MPLVAAGLTLLASLVSPTPQRDDAVISESETDRHGVRVHSVESPYQAGVTWIRVLLPDELDENRRYPVVFVLPVEPQSGHRFGDGLLEARKTDLANRFGLIAVSPTFSHLPWYADHPTDRSIRQESHFLKVVVPFVERTYPVRGDAEGRLLVGFSKSGWGAWTLALRHPERFAGAAAWDAPLMKEKPDQFGMEDIFGTQENFERYQVSALLGSAPKQVAGLRLVLTGYGNFRDHHQRAHRLMTDLGIRCKYRDGPERRHHWDSGWLPEAVELLLGD